MLFEYQWKLYKIPIPYNPNALESYILPDADWQDGTSTGIISDNMAIDQYFFTTFDKHNFFYRFVVEALRHGSSPNNKGISLITKHAY